MTTLAEALRVGIESLAPATDSARADAQLLLAHAVRHDREWLIAHGDAPLSAEQGENFEEFCRRRSSGEPVAYILGRAGFYGREFIVDPSVLIPRPESEHLVEEAIAFVDAGMTVLDVGVGCGAIACTIAAESGAVVFGTDLSVAAIARAEQNARRLGLAASCRFCEGDLTAPVRERRFHAIVANLPYIPTADLPARPDPVGFEPRAAVDGGPDGLALYRRLLPQIPALLERNALILLEAAPPTIEELARRVRATLSGFAVSIGRDYAGLPRYVRAASQGELPAPEN
jgi:release factor glutamine methyltransferase